MGDASSWVSVILILVVCGVYYYFVSKIGDKIAFKIEEAMWGDRYRWEGTRRTGRHYSVVFAIFATIWVGVKSQSGILTILAFAVTSVVFYTVWRVAEDTLCKGIDKGVDAVGNKVKGAMEKKNYNVDPEPQAPSELTDRSQPAPENEEMFCRNCGTKISKAASFCPYCGTEQRK